MHLLQTWTDASLPLSALATALVFEISCHPHCVRDRYSRFARQRLRQGSDPSSFSPSSFTHKRPPERPLRDQWIEEVRSICGPTIPIILVGCKVDLRPPSNDPNASQYVSRAQAERVAQEIGARAYKECSALKIEGVDDVFEAATRASMLMREGVSAGGAHQRRRSSLSGDREDAGTGLKCCVIC